MSIVTYPDGRTVEIDDGDVALAEYYRGEGATVVDSRMVEPADDQALPVYVVDADPAAQDAWVLRGTVAQIIEAVTAAPEIAESVYDAEQRRGDDARKTLLEALLKIEQPDPQ